MPVMMIAVVQSNFVRQATPTASHPQHPSDRSIGHRSPLTSPLTNFNPGLGVYNISYFCTRTRSGWEEGRERKGKERKGKEREVANILLAKYPSVFSFHFGSQYFCSSMGGPFALAGGS
jgi:hypothetical protein